MSGGSGSTLAHAIELVLSSNNEEHRILTTSQSLDIARPQQAGYAAP
jgi:predicted HAD superfamily phosphohydrolase YqeG